jgi:hypothetical protein
MITESPWAYDTLGNLILREKGQSVSKVILKLSKYNKSNPYYGLHILLYATRSALPGAFLFFGI